MLPDRVNDNLSSFFNKLEFVEATVAQLNKDLNGLFVDEINADFDSQTTILAQLSEVIRPIIQELTRRQPEQLSQFIYRVDLKEKQFFESIAADPSFHDLSCLIIEREAQKVWLRFKFA